MMARPVNSKLGDGMQPNRPNAEVLVLTQQLSAEKRTFAASHSKCRISRAPGFLNPSWDPRALSTSSPGSTLAPSARGTSNNKCAGA